MAQETVILRRNKIRIDASLILRAEMHLYSTYKSIESTVLSYKTNTIASTQYRTTMIIWPMTVLIMEFMET